MGTLDGRVAVVTGGARGQGRAHAVALAGAGADVAVWDVAAPIDTVVYPLSTREDLAETVSLVESTGRKAAGVVADIRDTAAVERALHETVGTLGPVDVLVANAGICGFSPFSDITDAMWDDMVATNLTGTFKTMRAVMPGMAERGYGRVVATSSMSGRAGNANLAHYTASKFGVIGLVKTLALETATTGVTVNAVCPSTVATPMVQNEPWYRIFRPDLESPTMEDTLERFEALNPLRTPWLTPEAVARAVMYLVSDEGFITGSVLEVGLGLSAFKP